ncbi:DMT family transporter [Micromonospora endolithica]|uniref:QacE family quaternary ammonium compound efflux SMR transporter n=1 Tax=Micromonospora endolithica TaxID=230091 RepID=A0A3A9ZHN9_9ACTN|nr:multidrug efflux SMR transporter [Micromonospora endolithica]RKN47679.1 QacE family quaternary ammonium compound efflux SMR transporter [Micromonospora endolithica]TWJ21350.1 small multidrug resistance pump [Micromonospora endolithica]
MTSWLFLLAAIGSEITATMALRASDGLRRKTWLPLIVVGYLGSFGLFALTLRHGMAVGVAYGIWAATGLALTAVFARILFKDVLTTRMLVGIGLVATGVFIVEVGAHSARA